jgi:hypothetical protein
LEQDRVVFLVRLRFKYVIWSRSVRRELMMSCLRGYFEVNSISPSGRIGQCWVEILLEMRFGNVGCIGTSRRALLATRFRDIRLVTRRTYPRCIGMKRG